MDLLLPFSTYHRHEPDFNESDSLQESEALIQRQETIQSVLYGEADADYLLDVLENQAIDPVEYVAMVEANVNQVINHQVLVIPPPGLLVLYG